MLLEDGLKQADAKNLQCTLGASPNGLGKRFPYFGIL